jgi:hypothetical protein
MNKWLAGWTQRPYQIFLLDALGALSTALLLLLLVAPLDDFFTMPPSTVHLLAVIAGCFFIYSLGCWWLKPRPWKPYLVAIIVANCLYCGLTLGLVLYRYDTLSAWGMTYFLGEILVVGLLVALELQVLRGKWAA